MSEWLKALFNDDKRDTTEVPKQILNMILLYHFIFITVLGLHSIDLNNV